MTANYYLQIYTYWSNICYCACVNFNVFQGVSQLAALRVDAHTTYEHSASVDDFQEALSAVIEDELLTKVKTSG
ncbi:hypothetical protein DPMN_132937 [Dreissena polymorpha]|uniref:Uncharacterized protein n=1 Tax=Dreissena polymorpha TaxID=45954 RepID=A0A9D4JDJ1_DREPO|nr:hypothetical protein DPMN_132937 [Dreissena polymorpha]